MKKITALIVASTLALGAANLAHAAETTAAPAGHAPTMPHKGKPGMPHDMMFKGLNLTDEQKQKIRTIQEEQRDKMHRVEEARAMHGLIASDTFDKSKAEEFINKKDEQRKEMELSRLETQNRIYNVLTPEQKKEFNANFEKHLKERPAPQDRMAPPPAPAE